MWKLANTQFSAALRDPQENEEVRNFFLEIQENSGVEFGGAKDALLWLIRNFKNPAHVPAPEPEIIEKPVEVIKEIEVVKEVEKPLPENTFLLSLTADEQTVLKAIAENRAVRLKKEPLTIVDQLKHQGFQRDLLINKWGNYFTGLK